MKIKTEFLIILVLLVTTCVFFISGCTSPSTIPAKSLNPSTTIATSTLVTKAQEVNVSASSVTLALFPQDLPKGYNITYDGWLEGDGNCTVVDKLCMKEGYSISVDTGKNNTIDQNVMIYNKPATNANLETILNEGYPEFSGGVINELPSPGIGDVSRLWKYIPPKEVAPALQGYFLVFGKGNVYEIIHISGPSPDLDAGKKLAAIAAAKL